VEVLVEIANRVQRRPAEEGRLLQDEVDHVDELPQTNGSAREPPDRGALLVDRYPSP
jgi:hypothetical protein